MIEEDIRNLEDKIWDLENRLDNILEAIEKDDFIWTTNSSYRIQFQSKEEAQEWIDNQKKRDGSGFKKGSWLYGCSVEMIKPVRKLNL